MVTVDFEQILAAARQLPKPSQAQLVSALLQENGSAHTLAFEPLTGLSKSRVVHPGRLYVSASTRPTAQTTPAFKP